MYNMLHVQKVRAAFAAASALLLICNRICAHKRIIMILEFRILCYNIMINKHYYLLLL